eukprot:scaffold3009_cov108-Isochrysis_galbana.AAC.3
MAMKSTGAQPFDPSLADAGASLQVQPRTPSSSLVTSPARLKRAAGDAVRRCGKAVKACAVGERKGALTLRKVASCASVNSDSTSSRRPTAREERV